MEKDSHSRLKPASRKELRTFAFSFSAGMALLSLIGWWKHFPLSVMGLTGILALFHLICALLKPEVCRPFRFAVTGIARVFGTGITVAALTIFYYLFMTPFSVLIRWSGKDGIGLKSARPGWISIPDNENDPRRIERLY